MRPLRIAAIACLASCSNPSAPNLASKPEARLWKDEAPPPPAPPPPAKVAAEPPSPAPSQPMALGKRAATTSTEDYAHNDVNELTLVSDDKLSTFAVDVDTASYSIARRKILEGEAVPADAVRVEEFVNYFRYAYEGPGDDRPFAVHLEAAPSPYTPGRHLLRVGIQGREVAKSQRKPANLVFLVDVSGSMSSPDKLGLAQRSLRILVDNLNDGDTVALVTYAGSTRVVLEPTSIGQKAKIHAAIESLSAGGSTAMGSGIELAYRLAGRKISDDSISRVIVLSDGDANVGTTSHEGILRTIKGHVAEGVTLSTVGFGMGNYKDRLMEQLADKGNGNAYYIDSLSQAKRVFQEQLGGTLEVIAQDVKVQVEMSPEAISTYRLVGYENRDVADRDFRNDKVDAGEIGAGHSVTAVYEIELAPASHGPLATVRIRAKKPRGTEAAEHTFTFGREHLRDSFAAASPDFRFATAVVGFAEILRRSPYADGWKLDEVRKIAAGATPRGSAEREEFLELVGRAMRVPAIAAR
jgi:Ca-activated chloride channel homolog